MWLDYPGGLFRGLQAGKPWGETARGSELSGSEPGSAGEIFTEVLSDPLWGAGAGLAGIAKMAGMAKMAAGLPMIGAMGRGGGRAAHVDDILRRLISESGGRIDPDLVRGILAAAESGEDISGLLKAGGRYADELSGMPYRTETVGMDPLAFQHQEINREVIDAQVAELTKKFIKSGQSPEKAHASAADAVQNWFLAEQEGRAMPLELLGEEQLERAIAHREVARDPVVAGLSGTTSQEGVAFQQQLDFPSSDLVVHNSGGQVGPDIISLEVARERGGATGGWAPQGWSNQSTRKSVDPSTGVPWPQQGRPLDRIAQGSHARRMQEHGLREVGPEEARKYMELMGEPDIYKKEFKSSIVSVDMPGDEFGFGAKPKSVTVEKLPTQIQKNYAALKTANPTAPHGEIYAQAFEKAVTETGVLSGYPVRTFMNVADNDITVWLGRINSPGGSATRKSAEKLNKLDSFLINPTPEQLRAVALQRSLDLPPGQPLRINWAGNRTWGTEGVSRKADVHKMNLNMPEADRIKSGKWEGVAGDISTIEASELGIRTSTTRTKKLGDVGELVQFEDAKGKVHEQLYRITGHQAWTAHNVRNTELLSQVSQTEGWTIDYLTKPHGKSPAPIKISGNLPKWTTFFEKVEGSLGNTGLEGGKAYINDLMEAVDDAARQSGKVSPAGAIPEAQFASEINPLTGKPLLDPGGSFGAQRAGEWGADITPRSHAAEAVRAQEQTNAISAAADAAKTVEAERLEAITPLPMEPRPGSRPLKRGEIEYFSPLERNKAGQLEPKYKIQSVRKAIEHRLDNLEKHILEVGKGKDARLSGLKHEAYGVKTAQEIAEQRTFPYRGDKLTSGQKQDQLLAREAQVAREAAGMTELPGVNISLLDHEFQQVEILAKQLGRDDLLALRDKLISPGGQTQYRSAGAIEKAEATYPLLAEFHERKNALIGRLVRPDDVRPLEQLFTAEPRKGFSLGDQIQELGGVAPTGEAASMVGPSVHAGDIPEHLGKKLTASLKSLKDKISKKVSLDKLSGVERKTLSVYMGLPESAIENAIVQTAPLVKRYTAQYHEALDLTRQFENLPGQVVGVSSIKIPQQHLLIPAVRQLRSGVQNGNYDGLKEILPWLNAEQLGTLLKVSDELGGTVRGSWGASAAIERQVLRMRKLNSRGEAERIIGSDNALSKVVYTEADDADVFYAHVVSQGEGKLPLGITTEQVTSNSILEQFAKSDKKFLVVPESEASKDVVAEISKLTGVDPVTHPKIVSGVEAVPGRGPVALKRPDDIPLGEVAESQQWLEGAGHVPPARPSPVPSGGTPVGQHWSELMNRSRADIQAKQIGDAADKVLEKFPNMTKEEAVEWVNEVGPEKALHKVSRRTETVKGTKKHITDFEKNAIDQLDTILGTSIGRRGSAGGTHQILNSESLISTLREDRLTPKDFSKSLEEIRQGSAYKTSIKIYDDIMKDRQALHEMGVSLPDRSVLDEAIDVIHREHPPEVAPDLVRALTRGGLDLKWSKLNRFTNDLQDLYKKVAETPAEMQVLFKDFDVKWNPQVETWLAGVENVLMGGEATGAAKVVLPKAPSGPLTRVVLPGGIPAEREVAWEKMLQSAGARPPDTETPLTQLLGRRQQKAAKTQVDIRELAESLTKHLEQKQAGQSVGDVLEGLRSQPQRWLDPSQPSTLADLGRKTEYGSRQGDWFEELTERLLKQQRQTEGVEEIATRAAATRQQISASKWPESRRLAKAADDTRKEARRIEEAVKRGDVESLEKLLSREPKTEKVWRFDLDKDKIKSMGFGAAGLLLLLGFVAQDDTDLRRIAA